LGTPNASWVAAKIYTYHRFEFIDQQDGGGSSSLRRKSRKFLPTRVKFLFWGEDRDKGRGPGGSSLERPQQRFLVWWGSNSTRASVRDRGHHVSQVGERELEINARGEIRFTTQLRQRGLLVERQGAVISLKKKKKLWHNLTNLRKSTRRLVTTKVQNFARGTHNFVGRKKNRSNHTPNTLRLSHHPLAGCGKTQ